MTTKQAREQEQAREKLRGLCPPGTRIYTVLRHVSQSGMARWIDCYIIRDNQPLRITWTVADALGWPYTARREALRVNGCGMDIGFHAVHSLSYALHGMDNHTGQAPSRSGYTLTHEWM